MPNLDVSRRDSDTAILMEILTRLSEPDREAMLGFYCDGKTERQIEIALGVTPAHMRELRRSVRATFQQRKDVV